MDKRFLRLVMGFFSLVALLAVGVAIWQLKLKRHGGFEFRMHRDWYTRIVEAVQRNTAEHAGLSIFHASDLSDPTSITVIPPEMPVPERGKGAGHIWVSRSGDLLTVWIETLDLGHAGEYGYAYSTTDQEPAWDHDAWGERWQLEDRLEAHWWMISHRLD